MVTKKIAQQLNWPLKEYFYYFKLEENRIVLKFFKKLTSAVGTVSMA